MRQVYLILMGLLCSTLTFSQSVGINTSTPDASSILDIDSGDKGVLFPRVSLTDITNSTSPISSPAEGLLVYNTNAAVAGGDGVGFYYFDGTEWVKLTTDAPVVSGIVSEIRDADGDTKIQVEEGTNENIIRFDIAGTEHFTMEGGRLEVLGTGGSVFIGDNAGLNDDLSGNTNVGIGFQSLRDNTTGYYNAAVGRNTLFKNTTGYHGTAIGNESLYNNTTGLNNTAVGSKSLYSNTLGSTNVAVGRGSLQDNTTGSNNTAIGNNALDANLAGANNTAVGYRAGYKAKGSGSVYVGSQAGFNDTTGNKLYIENSNADSANALIYGEFDNDLLVVNGTLRVNDGTQQAGYVLTSDANGNTTWQVTADDQTLSLSGMELTITDGNTVDLAPIIIDTLPLIADADGDTKIHVEESTNEDTIRFDIGGTEYFKMAPGRVEVVNTGDCIFIGEGAGANDDLTSNKNVAIGHMALNANEIWNENVAIGYEVLKSSTTPNNNVAVGSSAMTANTTGDNNVAVGRRALYNNETGGTNTAIGYYSLYDNTTGFYNAALGAYSGYSVTTGRYNTAIGYNALRDNETSYYNTALGYRAGYNVEGESNVMIGSSAGFYETGSNTLYISNSSADSAGALIYGEFDSAWVRINGRLSPMEGMTDADGDTRIQVEASADEDTIRFDVDGTEYFTMHTGRFEVFNTGQSTYMGEGAGASDDFTDNNNVAIGYHALNSSTSGNNCVAIGHSSLVNSSGNSNTAIGASAMQSNTGGFANVAIGRDAMFRSEGADYNVSIGAYSLQDITQGTYNVGVGYNTMDALTTGDYNVAIGERALDDLTTGINNVAIGRRAGYNAAGSNNVFLGYYAGYDESGSDKLYIENTNADETEALIYGEFDNDRLRFNGEVGINIANPNYEFHIHDSDAQTSYMQFTHGGTGTGTGSGLIIGVNTAEEAIFLQRENDNMEFHTNDIQRMTIDGDGFVGIGDNTPSYQLEVADGVSDVDNYVANFRNTSTSATNSTKYNGIKITAGKNTNNGANSRFLAVFTPDGDNIGRIQQNGTSSVVYNSSSDIRLKTNIQPTQFGLADLMKIRVKDYEFKDELGMVRTGYIAQELYEVYPEAVTPGSEDVKADPWMVDYGQMTPLLVKAMQDQQQLIEQQQKVIEDLQQRMAELEGQ